MLRLSILLALLAAAPSALAQGPIGAPPKKGLDRWEGLESWAAFEALAADAHGDVGARAAAFLREHAPPRDANLDAELLVENLTLALEARERFPWSAKVPDELFQNDVLPYAVLDETRERWRAPMLEVAAPLVAECQTLGEAAQALNRELFNAVNVHYNTGRKKPNQSPAESIAQGRATCTGLSILLIDACRAVGVPARAAGVFSWHDKRGNHTWVEVWDGDDWRFLGADEYDAKGLDRGWFVGDASKAVPGNVRYAVWASSWRSTGAHFPLVWARGDESVPGVDVSERYRSFARPEEAGLAVRNVRVRAVEGGARLAAGLVVRNLAGEVVGEDTSRAGRADLNDMPAFSVAPGLYYLDVTYDGETRYTGFDAREGGVATEDVPWGTIAKEPIALRDRPRVDAGMTRDAAQQAVEMAYASAVERQREALTSELEGQAIVVGDRTLRLKERVFGDAPASGHSLWISMHGGGGAPAAVNDRQWQNQIRLYELEEGIYVAPRAPTDTWNLWHQGHIDPLFDRLIAAYVAARGVDPNRVYLLGYSAGGDGVYQLAPRMADRLAAAAMMAGHPNETRPDGLRNLPFALFMGGEDKAYDRNAIAGRWRDLLAKHAAEDPGGYPHWVKIYPGKGHWMDGEDREALPWMAQHTRDPWPKKVVWLQDDVTHERFYWLGVGPDEAVARRTIVGEVDGNTIWLTSEETGRVELWLSDALLDLDAPVVVIAGGVEVFRGVVPRTMQAIEASLEVRLDPHDAATAHLVIQW